MDSKWFTIDRVDKDSYIISEYRHWEETHCYLLNGSKGSLLIDTGLGIRDIYQEVVKLTDKPVTAAATHIHWDHVGGPLAGAYVFLGGGERLAFYRGSGLQGHPAGLLSLHGP